MQKSRLYVGNLNYAVTEDQLKELFGAHGTVVSVKLIGDRGFGFVEMSTPEEAEHAMEALNDSEFQDRKLRVNEAHPQKPRDYGDGFDDNRGFGGGGQGRYDQRGGGRGGSGGRGGGRGGSGGRGGGRGGSGGSGGRGGRY